MSKYTKEDIIRIIRENDVKFVRLQFTDIFGTLKNVAITTSQVEKALDNKCMFDGSSIEGFVRIEESDMYLWPDLDTFVILPWHTRHGKIARLICDVYKPDGTPFEGDPRYILRKAIQDAADMGYSFNVGPECEFFLFNTDEYGHPTTITHDTAGYFDMGPSDLGESCRRDICLTLEDMGFEIEAFGGREYSVRAVPANLFSIAKKELLLEMLDDLAGGGRGGTPERVRERIASLSCKAAVKGNHALSAAEANRLIDELLTLENPYACPHGRPTIISMSRRELEKKFKRIV